MRCRADDDGDQLSKGYDYLLGMKLWSLTLERVRQMENELEAKTEAMALLKVGWIPMLYICFSFFDLGKVCR